MKTAPFRRPRTVDRSRVALDLRPSVEAFEPRVLLASTNFLQGVVLDTSNNPVQNAIVTLYSEPGNSQIRTPVTTGASGTYTFSGLATGNYKLVETPPAGFANNSTADVTGLYQTTLGTNSINVTISDGTAANEPWLVTPLGSNKLGINFTVPSPYLDNSTHNSEVGQLFISADEQDVNPPSGYTTPIFSTFCVDLNRNIFPPPFHNPATDTFDVNLPYNVMPLASALSLIAGTSATNAGEIAYLYNKDGLNTSLSPTDSAGLQLAIWDLEYGSVTVNSLVNPPSGVTLTGVINSENAFLSMASGKSGNAYYVNGLPTSEYPGGSGVPPGAQGLIATELLNFVNTATTTPAINTSQQPASATVGTSIADKATVSGGNNPTGTVTFTLFSNPNGTGTPLFTDANVPLSGGMATSTGYIATATGTDYWVATYNGDANNASVTSGTASEPVIITPATPAINTSQLPPSATVGTSIADKATVSGGFNPSGTVTFTLFSNPNGTGTPLFTDANVPLSGGMATSTGYIATATGTDYWVATYNGDANNASVTSGTASEPVSITPVGPAINTSQLPPSATVGTSISDKATVSGGNNPTGTVTFTLFSNPNGTGTPLFTDANVPLSNGMATSTGYIATATGTDFWVATYNGDANNASVTSGTASEPVSITPATPAINTSQLPPSATVGTSISDKATVSGGFNPSGTVTFTLFSNPNGTGTPLFTDANVPLSGGMATSTGYIATATGTDYWVATYNGDANNASVTSGTASEPVSITPVGPAINTSQLPPSATVGTSIADKATVSGGNNPTGTVTFTLFSNPNGTGTPLFTDANVPLSGGMATSTGYIATATGTDFWVATYNGDANNASVTSGTASEPVIISPATPAINTSQLPPSATVGTAIADKATVTGGFNPSGTVTFTLFSNPNGTGTPLFTDANVPLSGGMATSTGYIATATGTDYWVATYNGDANNASVTSGTASEPVVITPGTPGISIVKLTNGVNDPNPNDPNVPQLAPGAPVTWTYLVTNTGNIPFAKASVVVTDNQPGVTPAPELNGSGFVVGDSNDNNFLDPGETWTYIAMGTALNLSNPPAGVTTVPIGSGNTSGVTLGTAANFAVVAPNGFNINGPGTINGNVASGNKTVLTNPAVINGTVFYSGSTPTGNVTPSGGIQMANLTQVFADAETAQSTAMALPATQTFGNITSATTINGNGGLNVVDVSGINLSNGALTLNGTASDVFIVNVAGNITSSNSNIAISGGVTPNHVLINVTGTVTITGGGPNNFYGTILDPNGAVTVHDKLLTGELIGNTITDTSGFSVNFQPFAPPPQVAYENTGKVTVTSTSPNLMATYVSNYRNPGGPPAVSVNKQADASTIVAGQTAGYTVTIGNTGTGTATGVTLSDPLPPGAGNDITWTIDTSVGNPTDFTITGAVGSQMLSLNPSPFTLAAGASISVHVTGMTHTADAGAGAGALPLGAAGSYAVLYDGIGGHNLQITNVTVNGSVGVGGTGHVQFNGPGTIGGRLDFSAANTGQYSNNNGSDVGPTSVNYNVAAVTTALNTVNSLNSSLAGLGNSLAINGNQTINESAGALDTVNSVTYRVFNVTSYSENDGNLVTINGDGSGDPVVFNFGFNQNVNLGGDVALTGGLTSADDVLWNFTSTNQNVALHNNASSFPLPLAFQGDILAPSDAISVVNSTLVGRVFGGNSSDMQIVSGDTINAPPSMGTLVNTATVTETNESTSQSGTSTITITAAPQLATGSTSAAGVGLTELLAPPGSLQAGQIPVAVNLPPGAQAPAVQAGIALAMSELNAEIAPLGLSLVPVSGALADSAQVQISFESTSAIGGVSQGVIAAYTPGQITLINGWNWYFGSDANGIAPDQYDFQTVVTHELGHVLGLGENSDPSSVMDLYLSPGQVRRDLTADDLSAVQQELQTSPASLPASLAATASGDTSTVAMASPSPVMAAASGTGATNLAGPATTDMEGFSAAASSITAAPRPLDVPGLEPLGDGEASQAGPLLLPASLAAAASDGAMLVAAGSSSSSVMAAAPPVLAGPAAAVPQGFSDLASSSRLAGLEIAENRGMIDQLYGFASTAPTGMALGSYDPNGLPIEFGSGIQRTGLNDLLAHDHAPTPAVPAVMNFAPLTWLAAPGMSDPASHAVDAVLVQDWGGLEGTPEEADEWAGRDDLNTAPVIMGVLGLVWSWRSHLRRSDNDRDGRHRHTDLQRRLPAHGLGLDQTGNRN